MKVWKKVVLTAVAVGVIGIGWWLGSPLFLNEKVNEALPAVMNDMQTEKSTPAPATKMTYAGTFMNGEPGHNAAGKVTTVQSGDQTYLRFEQFESTNGPDLYVFLAKPGTKTAEGIKLAKLKGNIGDQNYELPKDVDLSVYSKVVIYCNAFHVDFGYADLEEMSINSAA